MKKVPFKVSARAARLIGRENVATSQGAVTELVKNSYDADASICTVLFLPRWNEIPEKLSAQEYRVFKKVLGTENELFFEKEHCWFEKEKLTDIEKEKVVNAYGQVLDLWIIDNGHGMSTDIIENHWMVIGTDTKELNDTSAGGRVVTGAKGIGRFALDRLGQECEMFSAMHNSKEIAHWLVDWADFEGSGKIISQVEAVLDTEEGTLSEIYFSFGLDEILPKLGPDHGGSRKKIKFDTGTAIRIGLLNDIWDARDSLKLKETLEALLPPHDRGDFDIYVYDYRVTSESGYIDNFPPDQFDYSLNAIVSDDGNINIKIIRQEVDVERINPTVFTLEPMKKSPFKKEDFERGFIEYETTLEKLLVDVKEDVEDYKAIGGFSFNLYFFKLANPTSDNLLRFPQKNFDLPGRRRWLKNSGGIRLYRDNFRVRPYGEPKTAAYDWLLLGERSARNPAQASRLGWRAPPQQIAGTVHITKSGNPLLADQSNREGIINERAFSAFRNIVIGLIREFERDRAYILQQFSAAYDIDNPEPKEVHEGRRIAEKVLKTTSSLDSHGMKNAQAVTNENKELRQVSQAYSSEVRKNELLRDNIQVMRGMATLGTVLISFTHELKQIKANIDSRSNRLSKSIQNVISDEKIKAVPDFQNPFRIIDRLQKQDEKVSRWVDFALSAVSPSKRRRRVINIKEYIGSLELYWEGFLSSRSISFQMKVKNEENVAMLAHEIDLDSIFYNLINNSVEALVRPSKSTTRNINITLDTIQKGWIDILYEDNGPGISQEFHTEDDIFMYGVSSKKEEASGDAVGTGLGMWLLKNVVDDYKGHVSLQCKLGEPKFSILIRFPSYKTGVQ